MVEVRGIMENYGNGDLSGGLWELWVFMRELWGIMGKYGA